MDMVDAKLEKAGRDQSLVSIIMPAFNAEAFIAEAIRSVLGQIYAKWELIIINDGSTDSTKEIVATFTDQRIFYKEQSNRGVSVARNVGLSMMKGDFLCFLDADDVLTPNSLIDRLKIFNKRSEVSFVDGEVLVTGSDLNDLKYKWVPSFKGNATNELIRIRETCFVTISWMIRRSALKDTYFNTGLKHAEDLLFLAEISRNGQYDYTRSPILYFRRTGLSAMANFDGLAVGYVKLYDAFKTKGLFTKYGHQLMCKLKIAKIMFLTFWTAGRYKDAFRFCFKFLPQ